jgi:tetratricopeptide (TPR) repeat protein
MRAPAALVAAPRHPIPRPIILIAASLMAVAISYGALALRSQPPATRPNALVAVPGPAEAANAGGASVDLDRIGDAIATWTANLERDPADFIAAVNLSGLYLARANLTASTDDYDRALRAVDRALQTDPSLLGARVMRARVLLASHDFTGAEGAATDLLVDDAAMPAALAILGDARLELGDYAGAADAYGDIPGPATASLLARQARLAAVTGSLDQARALAADASALAQRDPDATAADRSFYHLLAGAVAHQAGDPDASLAAYRAAVEAFPGSPQALAGLGRAEAAVGELDAAIASLERAVAVRPEPDTLATLGDLLTLVGRPAEAATRYEQVRGIAAIESEAGLFSRSIALFLADHGEALDDAVAKAEAELDVRTDVYGWDAYAWALYAAGRHAEADSAIAEARARGTEDALLDYHAGMIAAALDRFDEAAALLRAALERDGALGPLQAARAHETLAATEAQR